MSKGRESCELLAASSTHTLFMVWNAAEVGKPHVEVTGPWKQFADNSKVYPCPLPKPTPHRKALTHIKTSEFVVGTLSILPTYLI